MEVSVVLHKDGTYVVEVPVVLRVVVDWHYNAERELFVLADAILALIVISLRCSFVSLDLRAIKH